MQARIYSTLDQNVELPDKIINAFRLAINEALLYVGRTAPNPPVGCTILDKEGNVLTVAAHHQAGTLHAEALAIQQCRELGVFEDIYDVIVTLEPCNHTGRTPPCSKALLETPVQRIWVGVKDPNPHVLGAGRECLQNGGRQVIMLDELSSKTALYWHQQCNDLLAPFTKFVIEHKTWITVKQALNLDGSMYPPVGQKTFTSINSLRLAHQLRRGTEAIVTGMNTIQMDNPSFTVRHVVDHPNRERLLVVCTQQQKDISKLLPTSFIRQMQDNGFLMIACHRVEDLPTILHQHKVMWAMVEAGPVLLQEIRQRQIWDEWMTIRQQPHGEDEVSIISRHLTHPTRCLLTSHSLYNEKENLCSLVS